jgi:hypothetical protein
MLLVYDSTFFVSALYGYACNVAAELCRAQRVVLGAFEHAKTCLTDDMCSAMRVTWLCALTRLGMWRELFTARAVVQRLDRSLSRLCANLRL